LYWTVVEKGFEFAHSWLGVKRMDGWDDSPLDVSGELYSSLDEGQTPIRCVIAF
jgi:hypothetical protein